MRLLYLVSVTPQGFLGVFYTVFYWIIYTMTESSARTQTHSVPSGGNPSSSAGSGIGKKRGRGLTRGIGLAKKVRSGKLEVEIPPEWCRAVGKTANDFVTELSVLVHNNVTLKVEKWKQVPNEHKNKILDRMKEKFVLDDTELVRTVVFKHANRLYRDWRRRLHAHYLQYETDEERLQHVPADIYDASDWEYLIQYFGSEKYKMMSERNKKNRALQEINHIAGRKGFAQVSYEARDLETGKHPDMHTLWKLTHQRSDGSWIDEQSQRIYDNVNTLLDQASQPSQNGEEVSQLTPDEAFQTVIGPDRSSHCRGRGAGPRPTNSTAGQRIQAQLVRELEESRRNNQILNHQVSELRAEVQQV